MKKPVEKSAAKKRTGNSDSALDAVFSAYPNPVKAKLLALRRLIFDTAKTTKGVGALEEALKWGQPSYLTTESKSGSTIRIDQVKAEAGRYAVYFHCQTDLVETFRELYPELRYGGNRSILLDAGEKLPEAALRHCVALALTYHSRKRKAAIDVRHERERSNPGPSCSDRIAGSLRSHPADVASLTPPAPRLPASSSCPASSTCSRSPHWAARG